MWPLRSGKRRRNDVSPISNFGVYSAIGVLASLVFLFAFLPAAMSAFPPRFAGQSTKDQSEGLVIRFWEAVGRFVIRWHWPITTGCVIAMIAVGVYGADALQSLRFAALRLLVAVGLGTVLLSLLYFLFPITAFWRSNLLYAIALAILLLLALRVALGKALGSETFKRRIVVMGAGQRAQRIKALAQVSKQGFTYVFDRATGEPVWPIEERTVATDTNMPREYVSPTQPFPTKPAPFDSIGGGTHQDKVIYPIQRVRSFRAIESWGL